MSKNSLYLSKATKDHVEIKTSPQHTQSMKLFQLEGIRYIHKQFEEKSGAILNDETGLGKTVQAILYISAVLLSYPWINILIVTDEKYIKHWLFHLSNWCNEPAYLHNYDNPKKRIIVSTLDNSAELIKHKWSIMILDEVDPKLVIKKFNKISCKFKLWLWNDNLMDDLLNLFTILCWITPTIDMKFKEFFDTFCIKNDDMIESWKRKQLLEAFCKPLLLRRTKYMVSNELPLIGAKKYAADFNIWEKEYELNDKFSNESMNYESTDDSSVLIVEKEPCEILEVHSSQSNDYSTMSPSILDFQTAADVYNLENNKRKGTKDETGLKIKHSKHIQNEEVKDCRKNDTEKMACSKMDTEDSQELGDQPFQILGEIIFGKGNK